MKRFLNPAPRNNPNIRLVCLPFAGAAAAAYRTWGGRLPEEIEVLAVQLPGKGWRLREDPLTDLEAMAALVVSAIREEVPAPFAIFGHSMGAWMGIEVVGRLEEIGLHPRALVVSGRQAPAIGHTRAPISHLDDDAFVSEVDENYGGIPPEIMAEPETLQLLLPALRADFLALESFDPSGLRRVTTPILAMGGFSDTLVPVNQLPPWAETTEGQFRMKILPGGHFYFNSGASGFFRDLADFLMSVDGGGASDRPGRIPR